MEEPAKVEVPVCPVCLEKPYARQRCQRCYEKLWYAENKAKRLTQSRDWASINKERKKAGKQRWRVATREREAVKRKEQKLANPLKAHNSALRHRWGREIRAHRSEHPELFEVDHHTNIHGPYVEWYYQVLESQGGHCAVPGCTATRSKNGRMLAIDHCHATGRIRGLLCSSHNLILGLAHDRLQELEGLAAYLRSRTGDTLVPRPMES